MNMSDRGGAGPQVNQFAEWQADRERCGSDGAPEHPLLADVRSLTREQIDELGEHYGSRETAAARIAAAATMQLQNVRIATGIDDSPPRKGAPSMFERLAEIDAAPELTAEDKRVAKSGLLRRHGNARGHAHAEIRREMFERDYLQRAELDDVRHPVVRTKHELKRDRARAEARQRRETLQSMFAANPLDE